MKKDIYLQKELILNDSWDILIILDACRYDFFEEVYNNYFEGKLYKVKTNGSCTNEWCKNTFTKYNRNIIYISSNPYISSKKNVAGFDAKKYFYKIYDAWNFGWNEKLGTVHPGTITQTYLCVKEKHHKKRYILHYLQPHSPYISFFDSKGYPMPDIDNKKIITGIQELKDNMNIYTYFYRIFWKVFKSIGIGNIYVNNIGKILGFPPSDPMNYVFTKYGISALREAYKYNLNIVLENISNNIEKINGKIIITSDHGELLGENNMIGHPDNYFHPTLQEVPWFEVE